MNNIRVYSKAYCPYCAAAKQMLKSKGLTFTEIDVLNAPEKFDEMVKLSNRRTVPQIFFDDNQSFGRNFRFEYEGTLIGSNLSS